MPMYSYICDRCGNMDLEFRSMRNCTTIGGVIRCPKCHAEAYRRVVDYVHTDLHEFHKPIEMLSVACDTMDQVREIQRKCPGVQINDDPTSEDFGIPVVKNRREKKDVLKAVGYVEKN